MNIRTDRSGVRSLARAVAAAAAVILAGSVGCDETLPPRIAPPVVLQDSMFMTGLTPWNRLLVVRDSIPLGSTGAFDVEVKNIYDEVLSDSARIRVKLEIWLVEYPETRGTFTADEWDLKNFQILRRGHVTLGIDSSMIVVKKWNHRTDDGIPFWDVIPSYPGVSLDGQSFCQSDTVTLAVRGTVQTFEKVQPLPIEEQHIPVVYRVFGVTCRPDTTRDD